MKWTDAPAGSALHGDDGKLIATVKVRPIGATARWFNGMTWDVRDQTTYLPERAAKESRVRYFKTRTEAKRAIEKALI